MLRREGEDEMEDVKVGSKRSLGGVYRKSRAEVRLLTVACLCFIVAQSVVKDHAWSSGFRIAGLLAVIAVIFLSLPVLRSWRAGVKEVGRSEAQADGPMAKMSVEMRLLSLACLCFVVAQYVVDGHPGDHGFRMISAAFRIAALLTFIAGQWIGLRARRRV